MEIGKIYKIIYKDRDYTKLASGPLISEELHLIEICDIKEGLISIGKSSIVKIKEIDDYNKDEQR